MEICLFVYMLAASLGLTAEIIIAARWLRELQQQVEQVRVIKSRLEAAQLVGEAAARANQFRH